ncbi:hypothetical protein KKH26_00720 [Patescibacteria group bacterium]|nr:hypothetical protein [Patescibacteria group bacterium]
MVFIGNCGSGNLSLFSTQLVVVLVFNTFDLHEFPFSKIYYRRRGNSQSSDDFREIFKNYLPMGRPLDRYRLEYLEKTKRGGRKGKRKRE